ncbi:MULTISPECIES: Cbp1 family collagen-binding glycoprotein adhesin [unclassified Saccharicrinis]|uniref:Cbp1 family collagen-binding glycoprotein adhesin n=1 Tax=unclassified Saccharicrinis TaxID=2646859 RepID=UPI003D33B2A6
MRKTLIVPLLAIAIIACNTSKQKALEQQNDSLVSVAIEQQQITNDLVNTLVTIDQNLQEIKEKEKLIDVNMGTPEGNSRDIQRRINQDIQDIYKLMLANKEKIAELEQNLQSSGLENKNMSNLIGRLNRQLKDKSIEIIALKEQLNTKDIEIASLNFTVEGMTEVIDSIRTVKQNTQEVLDSTTIELYAAYYAFGTKKELKEHNVISSEGLPLFGKQKVLSEDFNEDYFTKVDIREVENIPLFRPKVKMLTSHPEGSYELVNGEEDTKTVKILDKEAFWSISKFMVVQVN